MKTAMRVKDAVTSSTTVLTYAFREVAIATMYLLIMYCMLATVTGFILSFRTD
jgi:hypothetical protein